MQFTRIMPYLCRSSKTPGFFIILIVLFGFSRVGAQDHTDHHDPHNGHDHALLHNEIAAGMGMAYSSEYQSFDPAIHFHAIKGITPLLGLGAGYELILAEELHQSVSALISLYPLPLLNVTFGAGAILPTHDESWSFTAHTEVAVTWPIGEMWHAGPLVDFGWSPHGYHLITGLHVGLDL